MSSEPVVLADRDGGVVTVTLNRPERLNALNDEVFLALLEHLDAAATDDDVRGVVLRGAGRAFCAGGDKGFMADRRGSLDDPAEFRRQVDDVVRFAHIVELLATMPKPTLALVQGHVVAAGWAMALACDVCVAAADARFRTQFVKVGLCGDFGITSFLVRAVGPTRARELLMLSPVLDARRALAERLVAEVVEPDELASRGAEVVAALVEAPAGALARIKANVAAALTGSLHDVIELEARHSKELGREIAAAAAAQKMA